MCSLAQALERLEALRGVCASWPGCNRHHWARNATGRFRNWRDRHFTGGICELPTTGLLTRGPRSLYDKPFSAPYPGRPREMERTS